MNDNLLEAIESFNRIEILNSVAVDHQLNWNEGSDGVDFFVGVFLNLMEILKNLDEITHESLNELTNIASVLQRISFVDEPNIYNGIDKKFCILLSSSIYSIIGFRQHAYKMLSYIEKHDFEDEESNILKALLNNDKIESDISIVVSEYYLNNNKKAMLDFLDAYNQRTSVSKIDDPETFVICRIIYYILKKLSMTNPWEILETDESNTENWKNFFSLYLENRLYYDLSLFQKHIFTDRLISEKKAILSFSNHKEQFDIANALIYKKFVSNEGKIVLVVNEYESVDLLFRKLFQGNYSFVYENEEYDFTNRITIITYAQLFRLNEKTLQEIEMVLFTDISIISDLSNGIKYEYFSSKVLKTVPDSCQVIFTDNNIQKLKLEDSKRIDESKINIAPSRLVNCFVELEDKKLVTSIESRTISTRIEGVFDQKFEYLNQEGKKKKITYTKSKSKTIKSCLLALQLISKGNRVNLLTAQTYHSNYGIHKLANTFYDLVHESEYKIIDYDDDLMKLKSAFNVHFGENNILSKLIQYGVIVYSSSLPTILRKYLDNIIENDNIRLVISNYSFSKVDSFKSFDSIVIHMIRVNAIKDDTFWPNPDPRDIKSVLRRFLNDNKESYKYVYMHNPLDIAKYKDAYNELATCDLRSSLENLLNSIEDKLHGTDKYTSQYSDLDSTIIYTLFENEELNNMDQSFFYSKSNVKKSELIDLIHNRNEYLPNRNEAQLLRKVFEVGGNYSLYIIIENLLEELHYEIMTYDFDDIIEYTVFEVMKRSLETQSRIETLQTLFSTNYEFGLNDINLIIKLWLNGFDYHSILEQVNEVSLSIESLIFIISDFIEGYVVHIYNQVINYCEVNEIVLTKSYEHFKEQTDRIKYGCTNDISVQLYKINVYDRTINKGIAKYLLKSNYFFTEAIKLKQHLIENWDKIISEIEVDIDGKYLLEYISRIS